MQTYGGWSDYDFNAALAEALTGPKAKPRTNADLSTALYWQRFNEANGTPTEKELPRHVKLYGREGTEPFIGLTGESEPAADQASRSRLRRYSSVTLISCRQR